MQLSQSDIPFKLSPSGFGYLGVSIARSFKSLYSENFFPLLAEIKADFQKWGSLPLSLIGRINTVKMNILPKFLILFQCLPIFLPNFFFFKTIDLIIFLWNGKTPRVRQKVLQNCKFYGRFSLPNFQFYYWAANITKIMLCFRCHYSKTRLAQIFPNMADVCDRCGGSPCNLTHMFFSCPALTNFW